MKEVDDGAARKNNPPTEKYAESWERIFGKGRQNEEQVVRIKSAKGSLKKSRKSY